MPADRAGNFHILIVGVPKSQRSYHWLRLMTLGCNRVTFEVTAEAAIACLKTHKIALIIADLEDQQLGAAELCVRLDQAQDLVRDIAGSRNKCNTYARMVLQWEITITSSL